MNLIFGKLCHSKTTKWWSISPARTSYTPSFNMNSLKSLGLAMNCNQNIWIRLKLLDKSNTNSSRILNDKKVNFGSQVDLELDISNKTEFSYYLSDKMLENVVCTTMFLPWYIDSIHQAYDTTKPLTWLRPLMYVVNVRAVNFTSD